MALNFYLKLDTKSAVVMNKIIQAWAPVMEFMPERMMKMLENMELKHFNRHPSNPVYVLAMDAISRMNFLEMIWWMNFMIVQDIKAEEERQEIVWFNLMYRD